MKSRNNKQDTGNKFVRLIGQYKVLSLIVLVVLPFIVFKVFQKEDSWKELGKHGKLTKAVICDKKFLMSKRGDTVKYHYCFNVQNESYQNGVMYPYDSKNIELNIGDTISIVYLPDQPDKSIDHLFLQSEGYME